jgi:membrane protease subunit HflC
MRNRLAVLVGVVVAGLLAVYMLTYQVRYDQVAVVTTFDKASEASVERTPGLKMKWPWPVQKVTRYTTRVRLLEHQLEQLQTRDGKSLGVRAYVAWRVTDPLRFFVELEDVEAAEKRLMPLLSEQVSAAVGAYRMDQLVNVDAGEVALSDLEAGALRVVRGQLEALDWGIEVEHLGVRRLVLPSESTAKVFETMRKSRERMAANARSLGKAQAATIRSEARSAQKRILAFAERSAQTIRAQGDQEAARYYSVFKRDESLAIFLRKVEALRKILPHHTTFVLDADQLSLQELFGGGDGGGGGSSEAEEGE